MLIEPAASDLRFYIECQVGMFAWLFAFIICIFRPTIFWIMFHHFTAPAVFFSGQKHMTQSYDSVWQMNQSVDAGAYSHMDISMLFLAPLCLARPAVTPLPSSDSLLTECLFLIAQASLSSFGSFSAWDDGRSRIQLVML